MPDEPLRALSMVAIGRAVKWRPQTNRQKWLVVLTVMIMACAAASVVPSMRTGLLAFAGYSIVMGWLATESRRSRREREALAVRLAALPPADVPADVVSLVASGKKIQAISRYRQLTGASLSEARAVIDGL
jgi:ribosomal protein L7/L12